MEKQNQMQIFKKWLFKFTTLKHIRKLFQDCLFNCGSIYHNYSVSKNSLVFSVTDAWPSFQLFPIQHNGESHLDFFPSLNVEFSVLCCFFSASKFEKLSSLPKSRSYHPLAATYIFLSHLLKPLSVIFLGRPRRIDECVQRITRVLGFSQSVRFCLPSMLQRMDRQVSLWHSD